MAADRHTLASALDALARVEDIVDRWHALAASGDGQVADLTSAQIALVIASDVKRAILPPKPTEKVW